MLCFVYYRRGSWRPIGHMRPSSPLLDSVRDQFEGQDQMAKAGENTAFFNLWINCKEKTKVNGRQNQGEWSSSERMKHKRGPQCFARPSSFGFKIRISVAL